MTTRKHALMRIFWPSDAPRDHDLSGVLVGWRNSNYDVLVVGVLQGVDGRNVAHALRTRILFRGSPHPLERILERCGNEPLEVLGTLNASDSDQWWDPKALSMHTVRRSILPRLDCPSHEDITVQIIAFDRPDPARMQYLSLTPISLALGNKREVSAVNHQFDGVAAEQDTERKRKQNLIHKLELHSVIKHPKTDKELALPMLISQINCSSEINALMQKNIGLVGLRQKRTMSMSERVVESAHEARDLMWSWSKQAFVHYIWPMASKVCIIMLMVDRIAAEVVLRLLDWKPFVGSAALKDISATAQQVDIRLQQFCYWPAQYVTLHRRRTDWESITKSHPEYIRFFNSLWLVANDIIIGIALGSYIIENAHFVAAQVDGIVDQYSIEGLQRMIMWLMDWPAGLKLNTELAAFLGDLFLWVIDYWAGCMAQFRPILPQLIRIIGFTSFAGASLPISMFSDLVSLLTVHIYSFYIASARIYNWQLTIIISLFQLFRGKKRNVLRNRIDNCDYDLDQLLLGTILFTLLFFLLPTVAVFYATFAGARMAIIALKALLDTVLACLNHFPLFALMLRIKDSRRLPGGIRFELCDTPSYFHYHFTTINGLYATPASDRPNPEPQPSNAIPTAYIKLKSVPLPLSQTFAQYAELFQRLRKHYLAPRVFAYLISGQFVPPILRRNLYSLQYSMLPARRVGIQELWRLLHENDGEELGKENGSLVNGSLSGQAFGTAPGGKKVPRTKGTRKYWWSR